MQIVTSNSILNLKNHRFNQPGSVEHILLQSPFKTGFQT